MFKEEKAGLRAGFFKGFKFKIIIIYLPGQQAYKLADPFYESIPPARFNGICNDCFLLFFCPDRKDY